MRAHCLKYIRIKSFLNKISGSPLSLLGHFPNYEWRGPVLLSFFLLRAAVVNCLGLGSLHCYLAVYKIQLKREKIVLLLSRVQNTIKKDFYTYILGCLHTEKGRIKF